MVEVIAKFVFELPFYIEIQGECSSSPQSMKTPSEEIVVYAPALNSPYPFNKPPWSPDPEHFRGEVNGEPVWEAKHIIIDIRRHFPTIPIADEDEKALVTKAREILYKLLTLYRWRGKQLQIDVKGIEQFNYRLRYFDAVDNPIDAGPGDRQALGTIHLTLTMVSARNNEWDVICQDLVSGVIPEPYESLLLDARSVVSQEPRRAVLDTATACEVFIKKFCDDASQSNPEVDPVVYSALTPRGVPLLSYFHEVLKYLFKHSLQEEKQTLYKELDYLVRTNNSVKHEGKCQYKNDKGKPIEVDSTRARDFINAVEGAIQYTKSLGC